MRKLVWLVVTGMDMPAERNAGLGTMKSIRQFLATEVRRIGVEGNVKLLIPDFRRCVREQNVETFWNRRCRLAPSRNAVSWNRAS